ncbi:alpha/beta fold hydrolase [Psychrobacter jeotgali]|uniref:alpha/beta fold hydrolase n=1 Tax=Psychrobacter jeotgali TaxID=179010 RepID=UPI00191AA006|nr:alpha/beta fold hydrolase [Psychrobacter jeotgali]
MSLYQLKSQFQNQLRPISNELVKWGVTANQVTITAVLMSAGTAYIIATIDDRKHFDNKNERHSNKTTWLILPVTLFCRMALNAIDGMMAREHGQASKLGAVLNEVGDIVADTLLIASLHPHLPKASTDQINSSQSEHFNSNISLKLVNILSTTTELIAITSLITTHERANQGPLGKSDRALELGVIGTLATFGVPVSRFAQPLLLINQLLLLKTSFNRLAFMLKRYFEVLHPAPQLRENRSLTYTDTIKGISMAKTHNEEVKNNEVHDNNNNLKHSSSDFSSSKSFDVISKQSCFNAYDGTAIYYRYWLTQPLDKILEQSSATSASIQQKQVILLHRGHEHSGRLDELGKRYARAGYQVFAWDARGNGRSGGIKDHADSVTQLERDLNDFVQLVIAQTGIGIEDTVIVASSIGAVLAAAWVHDYAPTIRGMILGTPAISIRLYIPLAIPALKIARKFGLMSRVSSYVKAQVLTHDKEAQQAYNDDPLISSSISSDLLIDTHATGQRLLDDAGAITVPTFILCAGKDYVVDKQAEREFYEKLATPIKHWQLYPDSFHAIFHETNKADVISDCIDFADSLFVAPLQSVDLTQAHMNSASKDRVDRLAIKPFNPSFAVTRFAMQKFGHVSDAIATGLEHGFDSGSSLDKVYSNQPAGKNAFGKAVDKFYLSNIGWQGIRIRREHLLELGRMAVKKRQLKDVTGKSKSAIKLLDIASGNGYYAFDLLTEFAHLQAELRDYDTHNVTVMTEKAAQLELSDRVTVLEKDAFASHSYPSTTDKQPAKTTEQFDIAIASGVFELFSDNTLVSTAIKGIYDSLDDGGYFIYTNQPWHPEQEFISKTLNNHRGSSWVMRCRSQAEMDQLVTQAGFEKVDMRIDRFGIFTVSLAIKTSDVIASFNDEHLVNSVSTKD